MTLYATQQKVDQEKTIVHYSWLSSYLMIASFACCKIAQNKDMTVWQKGVIAFWRSKENNVDKVAEFAFVSPNKVKRLLSQWK